MTMTSAAWGTSTAGFLAILHDSENWIRVALSTQHLLKPALLKTLHNDDSDPTYTGLPRDKKKLFIAVTALKAKHSKEFNKCFKGNQLALVLPTNGSNETDSGLWDITTIHFFICNGATLPVPFGGYKNPSLPPTTHPKASIISPLHDVRSFYCWDAKQLRNEVFHSCDFNIPNSNLQLFFQRIKTILRALNYHSPILYDLETGSLDRFFKSSVNLLRAKLQYLSKEVTDVQSKQSQQFSLIFDLFKKFEDQKAEFLSTSQSAQIKVLVARIVKKEVLCKLLTEVETLKYSQREIVATLKSVIKELKMKSSQNSRAQFEDLRQFIVNVDSEMKTLYRDDGGEFKQLLQGK